MAILKPVVLTSREVKDGKNKVRISVAHNGDTRYIVTDIVLNSTKEFKNGLVVKRPDANLLNVKIRGLLQHYQTTLDELVYIDGLTCPELVYQLMHTEERKHRTLQSIFEEYMDVRRIKPQTARIYTTFWHAICRVIDKRTLVEHITHAMVIRLEKHLYGRNVKPSYIHEVMIFIKALLNYAKRRGYAKFTVDPFFGYKLPVGEPRQSWVSVEDIKKIRDFEFNKPKLARQSRCRDFFMLSYYLGGINLADLLNINFIEQSETIKYVRTKTELIPKQNKFVELTIPPEAKEIIARHMGPDGYLVLARNRNLRDWNHFMVHHMSNLRVTVGIDNLVYYSARKSFAQHAFNLGVSTSIIDYILGHKLDKAGTSLYSYISVTPDMATNAIRIVLDNLK